MNFADRLYDLRQTAGIKQTDLAQRINLEPVVISKYEKGVTQPTMDTLVKLAEIFSVSVDYLLGVSDIPNPYSTAYFTSKEVSLIIKFYKQLSAEEQNRLDERIKQAKALGCKFWKE